MATTKTNPATPIAKEALQAFDNLNGPQPGYRPAHAKGILLAGTFTPSKDAAGVTRAPHIQRTSTPVIVRFSDGSGIPTIPDNDPNASLRGMATRFQLAEHVHTDIIAHSVDAFPARTAEELVELLRAIYASGPGAPKPTPVETFLSTHPAALEFVQAPKPMPVSFARVSYFAIAAYKFTNSEGVSVYGRYRILPEGGNEFFSASAEPKEPNFLFDEIRQRLAKGAVRMHVAVQIAAAGDVTNDSTIHWPSDRAQIAFGTIELTSEVPNNDDEQRHIIFDPLPRVDGIGPSEDPLLADRADVYLLSGRRRRSDNPR